ncbi:MAG: Glucose-6-phosphate 1-dehydrogenase 2 [Chlamydiales bacterium]|nr:Glucose-6-phosphate 1-dehydrogenase 2 [Chlamydiales bacterium]MCH9620453.1 Glucose-6-phosphate 1-dehydrogenase 2 [Chlamydiales bacterium]MCH9623439.1 Glucose-6-phosphate 1-dehydrogenase 2 [Chlamydiales bacterium]
MTDPVTPSVETIKFDNPLSEESGSFKVTDPCIVVIFGATGDLTARKLVPALYNLAREGQLPSHFACVGFARRDKSHDDFRKEMHEAVGQFSRVKPVDEELWKTFSNQLFYHQSNFDDEKGYEALGKFLTELDGKFGTKGNRVFYLSTQPSFFPHIVENLNKHKLAYDPQKETEKWSRVIIEKPFGRNYDSGVELQKFVMSHLDESQIYRIDHYLGKETVQNILIFRFANAIFEAFWNNHYIDHVQITVGEEIGIGSRGAFFEEAGILRDIVQNHMMQLLSLVAMEPPTSLDANAIRDEKVKVLHSLRPIDLDHFSDYIIRGQYGPGFVDGESVIGYREENNVNPDSSMETYTALKLYIDNWRWAGVPFYLRAGKRLPKRATEIAITFKEVPNILFSQRDKKNEPNVLVLRIQPDEGIALRINTKVPGPSSPIQPVKMDFRYGSYFGLTPPEAYERLICDCILGDGTLFARGDEVLASWKWITPILERWAEGNPSDFPNYQSGSWGPKAADELLSRDGRAWRLI